MLQMYLDALGAVDLTALNGLIQVWTWGCIALALGLVVALGWEREIAVLAEENVAIVDGDDIELTDEMFHGFDWVKQAEFDLACFVETISCLVEGEPPRRDGRENPDGLTPVWYGI